MKKAHQSRKEERKHTYEKIYYNSNRFDNADRRNQRLHKQ